MAKKSITINLSLTEQHMTRIKQMSEYLGCNNSELIRRAIDAMHEDFEKRLYGFRGSASAAKGAKKEEKEAEVARIQQMSDEELTQHLITIGFSPAPGINSDGNHESYVVEGGEYKVIITYPHAPHLPAYRSTRFTKAELVRELIKAKLL
jgi:hypothetical protein